MKSNGILGLIAVLLITLPAKAQFTFDLGKEANKVLGNAATATNDKINETIRENAVAVTPRPIIYVADEVQLQEFADPWPAGSLLVKRNGENKNHFSVIANRLRQVVVQKEDGMCWAACVQMVMSAHGKQIDQDKLANEFRADRENKAATFGVLVRALCPELESKLKGRFVIPIQLTPPTSDTLIEELAAGEPVVVGLLEDPNLPIGHMCVVYASNYSMQKLSMPQALLASDVQKSVKAGPQINTTPVGRAALISLSMCDPAQPTARGIRAIDFKQQVQFMMSRRMALKLMEDAIKEQENYEKPQTKQKKNSVQFKLPF